jgi:Tol biopolymer transport system component
LAAQKAKEERIARERAEEDRRLREELELRVREKVEAEWKAREEAKRLIEEERLAHERETAERKAKEEVSREKVAHEKVKEEASRLAAQKSEEQRPARERTDHNFAQIWAKLGQLLAHVKVGWNTLVNYLQSTPRNTSKIYISFGAIVSFVALIAFLFYQLSPNITPDNNTLPFSGLSAGKVNVYWYEDNNITKLTQSQAGIKNWGPTSYTSKRIYFTSDRSGKAEIWLLMNEANEGKVLQITDTPGSYESWSPVVGLSGHVYFASNRSGKAEIWALT